MVTTLEIVGGLSDTETIDVAKELFRRVYTKIPYEQVREIANKRPELAVLLTLDEGQLKREVSREYSASLSRQVLQQYARVEAFEPVLRESVEKVRSSGEMGIGLVLALGILVNLTLLVASTHVTVEKNDKGQVSWAIEKQVAVPELVKATIEGIGAAVKALL